MKLKKKILFTEKTKVVDLQIADSHNFAVGKEKIIVHNSHLRPRGTIINGIGAQTPGAVAFMELFDKSSSLITQGSGVQKKHVKAKEKIRKGAMMAILECWHPDIIEFIQAKQIQNRLTKFNISVGITDDFMLAVEEDLNWDLIFPDTTFEKYDTEWDGDIKNWKSKMYPTIVYKTMKARELWDIIMKATYNRNEPGIFFIDVANRLNNLHYCEKIVATNPCGEQPLPDGGICLLGSINLVHFINEENNNWDFSKLKHAINVQVRMMDNVNDITYAPLKIQEKNLIEKRRIGMGVLGYASSLMIMNVRYGSKEALELTENLMNFITNMAYQASAMIAKEKGSFKLFDAEKYLNSRFVNSALNNLTKDLIKKYGLRNSHIISIAPNGNCVKKQTKVRTNEGIKSIAQIFRENKVDIKTEKKNTWIIPIKNIFVETINGLKRITGLFINSNRNVIKIKTKNSKIEGTEEHKVLVKVDEKTAEWKQLKDLKLGDKIIISNE